MAASRTSTAVAKRTAPAKSRPAKAAVPLEAVGDIDANGYIKVKIFGEPFTVDTDVNGWLLFLAGAGQSRDVVNLVKSVLVVDEVDGEDIEVTRFKTLSRFTEVVGKQKNFGVEKTVELINEITELAGNAN